MMRVMTHAGTVSGGAGAVATVAARHVLEDKRCSAEVAGQGGFGEVTHSEAQGLKHEEAAV